MQPGPAALITQKEATMPDLMMRCPNTGRPVPVGIRVTRIENCHFSGNEFRCKECGEMHRWEMKDVIKEPWYRGVLGL